MSNIANPSYELTDYARMIWRSWWIVVIFMIAGTTGGFALALVQSKTYESSASVRVLPTNLDTSAQGSRTNGEINLDTEAQIVKSSDVLSKSLELLKQGSQDPKEEESRESDLEAKLGVNVPPNTTVLVVTCKDSSPEAAQACAHAVATAYVTNRQAAAEAAVKSQIDTLQHQIDGVNAQIVQVAGKLATLPSNAPEKYTAQANLDTLKSQLTGLNSKMSDLTNTPVNGGNILADAQRPTGPSSPNVPINLGGGLAAGIILGLIGAVVRERADKKVRRGVDVPRRTDIPLLAEFPKSVPVRADEIFATYGTGGRLFSRLRNEVVASVRSDHRVVVVTSAARGQAATVVAGNLSTAFARAGSNVILVCANMEDGNAVTGMLGVNGVPGLADVLAGRAKLAETIQQGARQPGLRVVAAGGVATAAGLLQSEAMRAVIAELRRHCDYVILEAPAASVSADAQSLAGIADAAILVVETGRTELVEVADAAEQLHRIGTPVIGAVVLPRIRRGSAGSRALPASPPAPAPVVSSDQLRISDSESTSVIPAYSDSSPPANGSTPLNIPGLELPSAGHDQTVVIPRVRDDVDSAKVHTEGKR